MPVGNRRTHLASMSGLTLKKAYNGEAQDPGQYHKCWTFVCRSFGKNTQDYIGNIKGNM